MSWYNLGTVTLTTGSAIVDGAGTAFVGNAIAGQALLTPDGRLMEIAEVISATRLRLVRPYAGGSVGGVAYDIIPTSADLTTVIERLNTLITRYRVVVDGIGQGLIPDGSLAAPGLRFAVDPDTGFIRPYENGLALVAGGRVAAVWNAAGVMGLESGGNGQFYMSTPSAYFSIQADGANAGGGTVFSYSWTNGGQGSLAFARAAGEVARFDGSGNFLVGTTSAAGRHAITKSGLVQGGIILQIDGGAGSGISAQFVRVDANAFNGGAPAALMIGNNTANGRSVTAGGTLNAQGADYAEYMTKAAGCSTIAKGDACGVDRDGRLTKTWADAISFVVKSTDPSYVGGDNWGRSVGPRPEGPGEEPAAPIAPPAAPASEDEADVAAWQAIVAAYPAQVAAHQSVHAAWTTAKAAFDTALPVWEAALEAERQKVDRIAFAGQVPVNVAGAFAVGDYLIATASGAGIKAIAVPEADITFDQYRRRLGKVWAVRDGRAWVDVQHG